MFDPNCCLCNNGLENINHLFNLFFWFCKRDLEIVSYSPINANVVDIIDWIKTNISSNNPKDDIIFALEKCLLYFGRQIRDSRNNWFFKHIHPHPAKVIHSLLPLARSSGLKIPELFWRKSPCPITSNDTLQGPILSSSISMVLWIQIIMLFVDL